MNFILYKVIKFYLFAMECHSLSNIISRKTISIIYLCCSGNNRNRHANYRVINTGTCNNQ